MKMHFGKNERKKERKKEKLKYLISSILFPQEMFIYK